MREAERHLRNFEIFKDPQSTVERVKQIDTMKSLYKEFTTWIYSSYSCHPEPGPSNCASAADLQVEYRVLCKANHWLQTLGSRCSMCFDWLLLMVYFERTDSNMFGPQHPLTIVAKVLARLLANQPRNSGPLNIQLLVLMCWPCWPAWWVSLLLI